MYKLRLTTALNQVIQHTDHDPVYLEILAGEYRDCKAWALMRAGSVVRSYKNDSHLPALLRKQAG